MSTPEILSVIKAFRVLSAFDGRRTILTTADIAKHAGMNSKTVHRFLMTLENVGAISRVGRGQFSLGMTLADLGSQVSVHNVLSEAVMKHLDPLAELLNESVQVAVLDGQNIVSIAHIPSRHSLSIGIRIGKRWPAYCTAVGKMLLADLDDSELNKYIQSIHFEPRTSNTITSAKSLTKHLMQVRKQGYAINDQESERGMRGIAVPIMNTKSATIAALSVSGPIARLRMSNLMRAKEDLEHVARQITQTLYGGSVD
ncbi:MAG: IclR family transcriptional regulator [Pseudomonadales bacterium]|nr:IclR family transcriptional regulator [Pseudomonadales bacterium]